MRHLTLVSVAAVGLASVSLAKPYDPRLVPANAFWVAHVDAEAALTSTLGRYFLEKGGEHLDLELAKVRSELGIDPLKDVKGVTAFGMTEDDDDGVIIISTTAAADRAFTMAATKGEHQESVIDGVTIHTFDEDTGFVILPGSGPDERLIVAGEDLALIAAAVNNLKAPAQGVDLAKGAVTRGPGENSIVFFHASKIGEGLDVEPLSVIMQRMEGIRLDIGERQGQVMAELDILSADEAEATNIAQMVQGLIAMARFAGGQEPEAAPFLDLLNTLTQTTDGRTVSLRLSVDPNRLIKLAEETGALHFDVDHDDDDAHDDHYGGEEHDHAEHHDHKKTVRIGTGVKVKTKNTQPY